MERLIKQTRVRYSGLERENNESSRIKDRSLQRKSQSFRGEKKKVWNWFSKLLSGQTSQDYDPNNGGEYPTAVAATAFAIHSLEESRMQLERKTSKSPSTSLPKAKSKAQDATHVSNRHAESRKLSDKASIPKQEVPDKKAPAEKEAGPAQSIKKTPTITEKELNITGSTRPENATPEKAIASAPSLKKIPTFEGKQLDSTTSIKDESASPKHVLPSTKQSSFSTAEVHSQSSTRPGIGDSEADAWEKAEMAKIKERYDKLSATISKWEDKKKAKARRQRGSRETELEKIRAKALRKYSEEMERIKEIVSGAKAQAEQNRRNEELKVKEKANNFRMTGKPPLTCFCF